MLLELEWKLDQSQKVLNDSYYERITSEYISNFDIILYLLIGNDFFPVPLQSNLTQNKSTKNIMMVSGSCLL